MPASATADTLVHAVATGASSATEGASGIAGGAGAGTPSVALINGTLVTGGTAGTAVLQWAQNTQNASDTKLLTGSVMLIRKVA